jgi:urease accessory protein
VELVAGKSAVTTARAESPLKILMPQPRGASVLAYLSSYGGGLVAGDEIKLSIDVGAGARCYLGTQASTKIYRNPGLLPCGQSLKATLGSGAVFVLAPDPVQAFSGALYRQHQEFHLQFDSGLVLLDWLTSGRSERGERWAFTGYESRNDFFVDGRRIVLDSLRLDPADGPLDGRFRLGRFNCFALLALAGGMMGAPTAALLAEVAARPVPRRGALLLSASPIAGGALVRVAGEEVEEVRREVHRLLDFLPAVLHDDPRLRKW